MNLLVNEYVGLTSQVRQRWPFGLGRYLLSQVIEAMQSTGMLEVADISGKTGKMVFVNAHSVGISTAVNEFQHLATPLKKYRHAVSRLQKYGFGIKALTALRVAPPEWNGH